MHDYSSISLPFSDDDPWDAPFIRYERIFNIMLVSYN